MGQSRKDSKSKRVNFDNTREDKFIKDVDTRSGIGDQLKSSKPNRSSSARRFGNNRDEGKVSKFMPRRTNHESWYQKNPNLVDQVGRVTFSNPVGANLGFKDSVPGIMALYYTPSYGGTSIQVLNNLKESYYSFVVHANSRNYKYSPSDLLLMTLGTIECIQAVAELKRVYGLMRQFDAVNEYTPAALLAAAGYMYDDLRANYATMVQDINLLIAELRNMWIPKSFPILDRSIWLAENVFTDSDSPKAQLYMFVRKARYTYDQQLSDQGGILIDFNLRKMKSGTGDGSLIKFVDPSTERWQSLQYATTWEKAVGVVRVMIARMVSMQDRGMICGDILKAYGMSEIYAMPYLEESYAVTPVYDPEALMSIHNSSICEGCAIAGLMQENASQIKSFYQATSTSQSFDLPVSISPTDLVLSLIPGSYPTYTAVANKSSLQKFMVPVSPILNTDISAQPSPMEVVKYTRFTLANPNGKQKSDQKFAVVSGGGTTSATITWADKTVYMPQSTGSEVINYVKMFVRADGDDAYVVPGTGYKYETYSICSSVVPRVRLINQGSSGMAVTPYKKAVEFSTAMMKLDETIRALQAFDWAPIVYSVITEMSDTDNTGRTADWWTTDIQYMPILDYNNFTSISGEYLYRINRVVLYSLFDVPIL